jgi:two-component system OmpR family response regulator
VKLLIVEDEPAMAGILQFNFEQEGYEVELARDGFKAMELFETTRPSPENPEPKEPFDAIVLDLMLPGMSGYEICRRIRRVDPQVPVLVLSARTLAEDRMMAFDVGTDQYITKPFELAELLNRVRNVIERHRTILAQEAKSVTLQEPLEKTSQPTCHVFSRFTLDLKRYELKVGEEVFTLTPLELKLMRYFIEHEGQVLSRAQIMENVWDEPSDITTRSIDNIVLRLRRFIEPDPQNPQHILTVRGAGYRFVGEP